MREFLDPEGDAAASFRQWQSPDLVYVRASAPDGTAGYVICAADGSELALVETRELAFAVALQNDFMPVSVH